MIHVRLFFSSKLFLFFYCVELLALASVGLSKAHWNWRFSAVVVVGVGVTELDFVICMRRFRDDTLGRFRA